MEAFSAVLGRLVQFFLMMAAGYLAARLRIIRREFLEDLSTLITKLFLPVMIFYSSFNGNTRSQLIQGVPVLLITTLIYLALFALFGLLARFLRLEGARRGAFQALFIFGNTAFVGLPLLQALFGREGLLYLALFSIVDQAVLWSCGILLTSGKRQGFQLKRLLSPATVSLSLAIIFILLELPLPKLLLDSAATLGSSATGASMVYLGALFFFSDIKKVLKARELYIGILIKMILFPLLVAGILSLFPLGEVLCRSMVLLCALPTMTVIPMLAKESGEGEYAIGGTLLSLAAAVATMPLVALLAF